ncbi:MAG: adenylosuccinate synthetase, partial [Fibrobacter sp.]|nr:adenylosuccinate synthetase [Fibrobacter sp.]
MSNTVIVGSQWGDEGKAKVIDYLAKSSDIIVRFHGGANAGHTVIVDGKKFVFHMVPSGIMYKDKICVISNGVVFDAEQFLKEVDELAKQGVSIDGRVYISETAHLVLPYHKAQDNASEKAMGDGKIGTTGKGIGPAYADKTARNGIRVADLVDWDVFVKKFTMYLEQKKTLIKSVYKSELAINKDEVISQYESMRARLLPYITDTAYYLFNESRKGKSLLFEGAQGTFLDIDHGTYPFVTSSSTVSGCASSGSGIGPSSIHNVVGIVKV